MRRCLLLSVLMPLLFSAPTSWALEPLDVFPSTTFTATLLVQAPPGTAFSKNPRLIDPSGHCPPVNTTYNYNYTPAYPDCYRSSLNPPPVTWNVTAVMGVKVNLQTGGGFHNSACLLGDVSTTPPFAEASICSDKVQGTGGPGLSFGDAGAPLVEQFSVASAIDTVEFGAALDNIGVTNPQNAGAAISSTLRDGLQFIGAVLGLPSTLVAIGVAGPAGALTEAGGALAVIQGLGTLLALSGSGLTVYADIDQADSVLAQQSCLGGITGNPPSGSKNPQDAVWAKASGAQLYEGTKNFPFYLTMRTTMNYGPPGLANPPLGFGACQAASDVVFVIDRPRNPGTFAWTDGLAFQPRSADSAVVRRRNAVESFRVDPLRHRVEHDSWRYSPFQESLDSSSPRVGLAACNAPQSCSPQLWAEPVDGYVAGRLDPSGQHPPMLTHAATPLSALSPDPDRLVVFFVDDSGGLYVSAANFNRINTALTTTSGSAAATVVSATGLVDGQAVDSANVPDGATISALSGSNLTLAFPPGVTAQGVVGGIDGAAVFHGDTLTWQTSLIATGLPPNAPIAALRGYPEPDQYTLFWTGTDGAVYTQLVAPSAPPPSKISDAIAPPGAAIAALQRTPWLLEVFVVGNGTLWQLTGAPRIGRPWVAASIGPSAGQVGPSSPVAAVAKATNQVDLFYLDQSRTVQHLSRVDPDTNWSFDPHFPTVTASAGTRQLSAVSRNPDSIDIAVPCDTTGVCDISYSTAGLSPTPAISPLVARPDGPLSIVAARSDALDVISGSNMIAAANGNSGTDGSAFDLSWQVGAQSWSTTAPAATCEADSCVSFSMSVAPNAVWIAANDSESVHLSTVALNDPHPIALTFSTPPGVVAGEFDPTTVTAGGSVDLGFAVVLGTPPGPKGTITIIGNNGIETHLVTIDVASTPCAALVCNGDAQCGQLDDNCGHILNCGSCGQGLACYLGMCLPEGCVRPHHCLPGSVWVPDDCACDPL